MSALRTVDARVHEHIMGGFADAQPVPPYSERLELAWLILQRVAQQPLAVQERVARTFGNDCHQEQTPQSHFPRIWMHREYGESERAGNVRFNSGFIGQISSA